MGDDKNLKPLGYLIALLVVGWVFITLQDIWVSMSNDLRLALTMIFFVWILNWARKNLGSPRLAIVYALVLAYIIFFKHPEAVWLVFGILVLSIVAPNIFKGLEVKGGSDKMDPLTKALSEGKATVVLTVPTFGAPGYMPVYVQQGSQGSKNNNDKK